MEQKTYGYRQGLRDGVPISLGYFAVAFTLGIAARDAGFSPLQAMVTSLLINASAGEFAGFTLIAAGAGYLEVAIMEAVANARYLLMSCAFSQKLGEKMPMRHRLALGMTVTDEIFSVSMASPGRLNPFYTYGLFSIASPGWALGTFLGVLVGNVLPIRAVSALSVALYGMFLGSIIPPARKSRIIAGVILISFAASYAASVIPALAVLSSGMRTIILTVVIALAAAILFPVKEDENDAA